MTPRWQVWLSSPDPSIPLAGYRRALRFASPYWPRLLLVLLSGIAATCTAVLNTFERFAMPALAALVMPVSVVAAGVLLHGALGIWAVVWGTLLGALVHVGLTGWMMEARGYRATTDSQGDWCLEFWTADEEAAFEFQEQSRRTTSIGPTASVISNSFATSASISR